MANLFPLLLLLSLSGLAVALAKEIDRTPDPGESTPSMAVEPPRESLPPDNFSLPARDQFTQTLERPLFADNRRTPREPVAAPTPEAKRPTPPSTPKPTAKGIVLSAIIIVGKERTALLRGSKSTPARRLRVGDEIDGWRIDSIAADTVVVTRGDVRETLALRHFAPPPPPKPLPAAPRAGQRVKRPAPAALTPNPAAQRRLRKRATLRPTAKTN